MEMESQQNSLSREAVKSKVWPFLKRLKQVPGLSFVYGNYVAAVREWRSFRHIFASRRYLRKRVLDSESQGIESNLCRQRVLVWDMPVSGIHSAEDLKEFLTGKGVFFSEGRHALYLPPQPGLEKVLGETSYPSNAGYKILKSFQPVAEAHYLVTRRGRRLASWLMQGVEKQVEAANVLYLFGLGPRLYDLCELTMGETRSTCFVVEHVHGCTPSVEEHEQFMAKLHRYVSEDLEHKVLGLVNPLGFQSVDFRSPDCCGNLVKRQEDNRLFYVDFQGFIVLDLPTLIKQHMEDATEIVHFGSTRENQGARPYWYQTVPGLTVPGKRDTQTRWDLFARMLGEAGIDFDNRVVLDICCNAGMMLAQALSKGALWGLGWDLPEVIERAETIQTLLGNTRMSLIGTELEESYPLGNDIPGWLAKRLDAAVVFYLAAWRHVGFMKALTDIPWKALVFEGHQNDSEREVQRIIKLAEKDWSCKASVTTYVVDGDSRPRPVVLFLRS